MVLVDTSVWIELFRKRGSLDLEAIVDFDEVVTCLPVIQEVLQGFRDEDAFLRARDAMLALPIVESPLERDVYLHAASLYRTARRNGLAIRSSADCLIGACAIRNNLVVLHRNRDFGALASISTLNERAV